MTPEGTTSNTQPATTAADGESRKAKLRHSPIVKFPVRFHCAITIEMGNSLQRLTGRNSLLSESDIGRLALHSYLMANDPQYVRAVSNGHGT